MILYSMTATFGKLEHETLTLQPGLNIIEAPNEWGKSTWCAFLTAMLFGMETRAKSTKTALADKERYAPWSGSPMAGRIDLQWKGRDITIERKTKGRVPLGQFTAYETRSGLPVPELTAANCGQLLLGVERSVFLRSGFIRLADMPVTQDEALRARLNALVTTGDESGDAERLGKALKDLKNRCRYNKSGLLPQAETEKAEIENKLRELETLEYQSSKLAERREQVRDWEEKLENHQAHLDYRRAKADAQRVAQMQEACRSDEARLVRAEANAANLRPRDEMEQKLLQLRKLNQAFEDLRLEAQMLPQPPEDPAAPEQFRGMDGDTAMEKAKHDAAEYETLKAKNPLLFILGILLLLAGGVAAVWYLVPGIACAALGLILLIAAFVNSRRRSRAAEKIAVRYGTADTARWISDAECWASVLTDARMARERYQVTRKELLGRQEDLRRQAAALTEGRGLEQARQHWESVIDAWDELAEARREAAESRSNLQTVTEMAQTAEEPAQPDTLSYTKEETARLLSDAKAELLQLQSRLNQYQGRMEALGDREAMRAAAEKIGQRIEKLEDTYTALTIAQQTLTEASMELQRRFAPRISNRAQELMAAFTGGRYDRLSLGEDLGLRAGAGEEDTLHEALWRSDGTIDQLYLSLRLAVAEALSETAPLILDDALVRFDDTRLKAALEILKQEAKTKQVILFTCQSREKALCDH